jgi:hypothetical protein
MQDSFQGTQYLNATQGRLNITFKKGRICYELHKMLCVVQSIILWVGCIVALLCITVDMWSHEMVCVRSSLVPARSSCVCRVFRRKVIVVKSANGGNRECCSLGTRKMSSSAKN